MVLTLGPRLFERGVTSVGLDFLAHPFWDKYLEFEERAEAADKIFLILQRIIYVPMHQYARYFERFRQLAGSRPMDELVPAEILAQYRTEVLAENPGRKNEFEIERDLRTRIDNAHLEVFHRTQTETTKRWVYEQEIKRPYFHVTELDEAQLANWRKYLDFEEAEGDYQRTTFLYERCLVAAAYYDEFWLRYARWMLEQSGKEEEVRIIYQRASCLYASISHPTVRLQYALFEAMHNRVDVARAIYEAMLMTVPGHTETIVAWANLERRHGDVEAAVAVYKGQIESSFNDVAVKGGLVAEWASLLWKVKGSPEEARQLFQKNQQWYLDVRSFWERYFTFELDQPTTTETEAAAYERIKQLHEFIRTKTTLQPNVIKDISHLYMAYLLERGNKDAEKEYMLLDKEVNGPLSLQTSKPKVVEDGKDGQKPTGLENGHRISEGEEATTRKGENIPTKHHPQPVQPISNGQVS